jgi:signal peptidase I
LNNKIYINDSLSAIYVVKQNYFFVLGDNRDNAIDSRTWGFLPEKFIAGKIVSLIKRAKP